MLPFTQPQTALLSENGDVRYGYLSLLQGLVAGGRASRAAEEEPPETSSADVRSVAVLLYRMCTGEQILLADDFSPSLEKIGDPLKRELIKRSLCAPEAPSATELTQIITEVSSFDVRQFSYATRALLAEQKLQIVTERVKAASGESAAGPKLAFDNLMPFGGELLLTRTAALAAKYKARTPPMQPCGDEGISVERVHEIAVQSCPEMLHAMRTFVEQAGGKLVIPPDTEIKLDDPELGVEQCQNTVKKLERAKSKAVGDYGGDARRLVDLVRASALFDFPTELANALDKFESAPATETDAPRLRIVRVKDRLDNPDAGYRDLMLNVAFHANGECVHIGELQLHLRPVFVLKKVAHVSYEISRDGVIELD